MIRARRSLADPLAISILLTGRVDHTAMRNAVVGLLDLAGLSFEHVHLRPVTYPGEVSAFKAQIVSLWLEKIPTLRKVTVYDDISENHQAISHVVTKRKLRYEGLVASLQH